MSSITESVDVDVPLPTAYDQWTRFESFPLFMEAVESVTRHGDAMTRPACDRRRETIFTELQAGAGTPEYRNQLVDYMIAPTRPHPLASDRPPLNRLLAPGAGLIDRMRDALNGRKV